MSELPPCGLYRTTQAIEHVPADRLVYFHNHGNPGPGIYLPEAWHHNRARWSPRGTTLPKIFDVRALQPLPAEGFYRVTQGFYCCAKQCTRFEPESFVQLGYNGAGKPIVFLPELGPTGIALPERGTAIDDEALANLVALQVRERAQADTDLSLPRGIVIH
ncbi:MAG TPA: hypothetical protein VFQ53_14925 [Kofleriaceae bacterium]|nr:hypothetical protein [Kofleriaceae bacterium]